MEKMTGVKCKSCGRVFYPKRSNCLSCMSGDIEEVELGDGCKLLTYTKLYAVPLGVDRIPLVLGIVEFENGARATGQIEADHVQIGMQLKPVWGHLRRIGRMEVFGFKFTQP